MTQKGPKTIRINKRRRRNPEKLRPGQLTLEDAEALMEKEWREFQQWLTTEEGQKWLKWIQSIGGGKNEKL